MTATTAATANQVTRFQKKVFREYVRDGKFGPFIGNNTNSIIQTNTDLKKHSIPLVGKLSGAGVDGSTQLSGSEEALSNYAYVLQPTHHRNGVLVDNEEREKTEFDLFREARPALMNWAMELKRDHIIQALGQVSAGGVVYNYGGAKGQTGVAAASAANMDTWNTNNQDRILYGALNSNLSAGDHTASLATIDTTADKMTAAMVSRARRLAENCDPLIRPYMLYNDSPHFVMFVGQWGMRDLKADTTISQANREARPRDVKANPIFNAGDLIYDGVIIKEINEIDSLFIDGTAGSFGGVWGAGATGDGLDNGGDTASRVSAAFLCGAQAVGFVMGKNAAFKRRKEDDYEFLNGVAVECKHDIGKTWYNDKQHGVVTVFHSSTADT